MIQIAKYCLFWYLLAMCMKETQVSSQALMPSYRPPYSKTHKFIGVSKDILYIACEKCIGWHTNNCSDMLCQNGCNHFYKLKRLSYGDVMNSLSTQKTPMTGKLIEEQKETTKNENNASYTLLYFGVAIGSCGILILLFIAFRIQGLLQKRKNKETVVKPYTII